MPTIRASRDQVISRAHTQVMKDAIAAMGKGGTLSKAEQDKLERTLVRDTAQEMRWAIQRGEQANKKDKLVRLEPLVEKAVEKITIAVDGVDKPGKGKGFISLAEAREAVATKGDAGLRIGKAFELITGASLEVKGEASAALKKAVDKHIATAKFDVLEGLADTTEQTPTAWVQSKIEDVLEKWGDGLMSQGIAKIGGETVHVATTTTWERKKLVEHIGFFDAEGRVVGRASIERNEDTFALKMKSSSGAVLAEASHKKTTAPADYVKALKDEVQKKYDDGEDLGARIKESALPDALRPIYNFMQRNTPDGTGIEKIRFQGRDAYAIHDYSCVSSVAVYSADGEQLMNFVS